MCTVSNVYDYGRKVWPITVPWPDTYPQPWEYVPPQAEKVPTKKEWDAFLELVEKARKFDEIAGQPDCEAPEKQAWFDEIERRLDDLEEQADRRSALADKIQEVFDEFA